MTDESPTLASLMAAIIARELSRIDAASKADCMGEPQLKTLEVISKILKQNPEIGEEAGRSGTVLGATSPEDLEAALKLVQK